MLRLIFGTCVMVLAAGVASAADGGEKAVRAQMSKLFPDEEVTAISESPVRGLYEVMLGASIFYMSADGRYVVRGDLIDLKSKTNLSDRRRAEARRTVFETLDDADLIGFLPASGKVRETLYVYTDIDCGYCRKLHREVPALNKAGIAVKYLAFPRSGTEGEAFRKATAVWCSEDRQKAMTAAKNGENVRAPKCENPVVDQFNLGVAMGVTGTPAVYNANGQTLGGYVPAAEIIKSVQ